MKYLGRTSLKELTSLNNDQNASFAHSLFASVCSRQTCDPTVVTSHAKLRHRASCFDVVFHWLLTYARKFNDQ